MSNKIFSLIPKIMGEIGAIGKNGTNSYDNYKFRSIDDVYNKVQPVLAKNGVFFKPSVLESNETTVTSKNGQAQVRIKMKVEYTFFADDGSSFTTIVEGEAIDRSDKATNKALTAALKYMLIQVFCIAIVGQDDADSESPEFVADAKKTTAPNSRVSALRSALTKAKKSEENLLKFIQSECAKMKIEAPETIDAFLDVHFDLARKAMGGK